MNKSPYRRVLETYLQDKETRGEPLPGYRGRVNYRGVSIETGISDRKFLPGGELRLLIDASVDKLGVSSELPTKQYHRAQLSKVYVAAATYDELKAYGVEWLKKHNYSDKSIPSYLSHLNAYMRYRERNNYSVTSEDFGVDFERRSQAFLSATASGRPVGSALRLWARIHYDLNKSKSLPEGFAPALTELVINSGRTQRDIARAAGIKHPTTLLNWMQGDHRPRDPEQVAKLEDVLNVLPGTLSSSLAFYGVRLGTVIPREWWPEKWKSSSGIYTFQRNKVLALIPELLFAGSFEDLKPAFDVALHKVLKGEGEPAYRQRLMGLKRKVYRLPFESWPDHLKVEFFELKEYKTAPSGLRNKKRRGRWNEATVKIAQSSLRSFFGFLCLPADHLDPELRGMGLHPESLSMAWLAVQEVVERYLDFRCLRSGSHNAGTENFIVMCKALLQPDGGWLWLHPELCDRLPAQQRELVAASGGWKSYCADVIVELTDSLASLKRNGQVRQTREPMR